MIISEDLKKIAKHLYKWEPDECFQGEDGECFVWWGLHNQPQFCHPNSDAVKNRACFTKDQWLQARKDLGLDQPEVTEAEEEEWQRMEWSKQITDTDDEAQALEDMVNHPPHYQSDNGIECIDAIRAALGLDGFVAHCRGTAIKYCWRSGKKQAHAEDLRKAAWYLNEAADALEES